MKLFGYADLDVRSRELIAEDEGSLCARCT
jgi:hypothetical protein